MDNTEEASGTGHDFKNSLASCNPAREALALLHWPVYSGRCASSSMIWRGILVYQKDLHLNKQSVRPRQAHGARGQNGSGCLGLCAACLAQRTLGMRQAITHLHRFSAQGLRWQHQAICMLPICMHIKAHKKLCRPLQFSPGRTNPAYLQAMQGRAHVALQGNTCIQQDAFLAMHESASMDVIGCQHAPRSAGRGSRHQWCPQRSARRPARAQRPGASAAAGAAALASWRTTRACPRPPATHDMRIRALTVSRCA